MSSRVGVLALLLACAGVLLAQQPRAVEPADEQRTAVRPHFWRKLDPSPIIPLTRPTGAQPAGMRVFFSVDLGRNWRKYRDVRPDELSFMFKVTLDGEYWLALRPLDREARPPASGGPAEYRLIVDTLAPRLNLNPEPAANGEILVEWQATDDYLDPSTIKLEYQANNDSEWTPIEIDARDVGTVAGGFTGRARFRPPVGARVTTVRCEAQDLAANVATASRFVGPTTANAAGPAATLKTMVPISPEPLGANSPRSNLSQAPSPTHPRPGVSRPDTSSASVAAREALGSGAFGESSTPAKEEKTGPGRLAGFPREEGSSAVTKPQESPPATEIDPYADRPRLIPTKRFNLDYDVESVGVSGVAEVELWGTNDRGQTWAKWGVDPDLKSPLEVDVSSETVYGFRIVVVGKNGLTSTRPKSGDAADVWVQIDATPPECRLTAVTYGQGEDAGKLDIRWEAADAQLAQRTVTLLMSDRPDGGWSVIAAALPNSGQYLWPYDPRAPQQIYLRLEVRDEAGNTGTFQTAEPIRVEGLTPKGRIRNVAPLESGARSPFRTPLFR